MVVPKTSQPGEPPSRSLPVDYRALNSLLSPVTKAHSKAKSVLTLVHLPKVDEIYARLNRSCIYSTFVMISGYHHIELSRQYKPKSYFLTTKGE